MKLTKRQKNIKQILELRNIYRDKSYEISDVVEILQTIPSLKFKNSESIDVSIKLGIDSNKSEHIIKGSTVLPHGNGKNVRIAVFADGEDEKNALEAGADKVGMETLYDEIKSKVIKYDIIVARLDTMKYIAELGPILGPRGMMPNVKMGTLTADIKKSVSNIKKGQINYKSDKNGMIHCSIGKINFDKKHIIENLAKFISDIKKMKPSTSKGIFLKKICLSTTMGPGIYVKKESLN